MELVSVGQASPFPQGQAFAALTGASRFPANASELSGSSFRRCPTCESPPSSTGCCSSLAVPQPDGLVQSVPKPIPEWDVHFRGLEDDRDDYTASRITFRPQAGGHRQSRIAICTFHLGFSLVLQDDYRKTAFDDASSASSRLARQLCDSEFPGANFAHQLLHLRNRRCNTRNLAGNIGRVFRYPKQTYSNLMRHKSIRYMSHRLTMVSITDAIKTAVFGE